MPYEPEIPPIPTRTQELTMIKNIEDDWLSQRHGQWNMAEADRIAKLELCDKLHVYNRNWYFNFFYGIDLFLFMKFDVESFTSIFMQNIFKDFS